MRGASAGWTNWSGLQRVAAVPTELSAPEELAAAVASARAAGERLRAVGSGHSFVAFWESGDRLVSLAGWRGLEGVEGRRVRLRSGTPIHAIGPLLEPHGLALANQGDIDRQSLAGAVATGTHGTGRELGSLSAQVVGLELIDGGGALRRFGAAPAGSPPASLAPADAVAAARVSVGVLGLITHITLEAVAAYGLHERSWRESVPACLEALDDRLARHRHFEFWWVPREDVCIAKSLDRIETPERPRVEEIPFGQAGERWGASYRIFPSSRELRFNEMEYAVPLAEGPGCFRAVRERLRARFPKLPWPVEYRVVAGDDGWLSPTGGEAVAAISVHQGAERDHRPLFEAVEPILKAHGGRPHWGKLHGLDRGALAARYPRHPDFLELRRELDPDGVYLNGYLDALLGCKPGQ